MYLWPVSTSGGLAHQWDVAGKVDGMTADPQLHVVIAGRAGRWGLRGSDPR
jgi:hypothetical protein